MCVCVGMYICQLGYENSTNLSVDVVISCILPHYSDPLEIVFPSLPTTDCPLTGICTEITYRYVVTIWFMVLYVIVFVTYLLFTVTWMGGWNNYVVCTISQSNVHDCVDAYTYDYCQSMNHRRDLFILSDFKGLN